MLFKFFFRLHRNGTRYSNGTRILFHIIGHNRKLYTHTIILTIRCVNISILQYIKVLAGIYYCSFSVLSEFILELWWYVRVCMSESQCVDSRFFFAVLVVRLISCHDLNRMQFTNKDKHSWSCLMIKLGVGFIFVAFLRLTDRVYRYLYLKWFSFCSNTI